MNANQVAALEFTRISKSYEGFALKDVSFSVPPGYITGLVGPNGAGKTTLVRLALGLAATNEGTVRVFGEDPRLASRAARGRIGFVHDSPAFYDYLTVERVAAIVARRRRCRRFPPSQNPSLPTASG
jgi:ABC-2 type transport system ATP-binding protein